jgi:hypothetical protein
MSSTDVGTRRCRWLGVVSMLVVAFAFTSSLAFSATPRAQPEVVADGPAWTSPTVEAAVVCAAAAAYGWIAVKFYDIGREVGRSFACQPRPIDRPDRHPRFHGPALPEYLLD